MWPLFSGHGVFTDPTNPSFISQEQEGRNTRLPCEILIPEKYTSYAVYAGNFSF